MSIKFLVSLALALHPALHHETRTLRTHIHRGDGRQSHRCHLPLGSTGDAATKARLRIYVRCQRNRAAEPYVQHVCGYGDSAVPLTDRRSRAGTTTPATTGCGFHAT